MLLKLLILVFWSKAIFASFDIHSYNYTFNKNLVFYNLTMFKDESGVNKYNIYLELLTNTLIYYSVIN